MIKGVSAYNFKGKTFNLQLGKKTLLFGTMGTGKTSVLQAVTLGMLGRVPKDDKPMKRPMDSMRFASGDLMNVGTEYDNGFSISRKFYRKGTGATSSLDLLPLNGARSDAELEARIVDETGCYPMMFNLQEFLAMSDNQKKRFIFGLRDVDPEKWTREKIVEGVPDNLLGAWPEGTGVREGLDALLDAVKKEITMLQRDKKNNEAACRNLSQSKAALGRTGAMSLAELITEQEVLQKELTETETQLARDEERVKAYEKREYEISNTHVETITGQIVVECLRRQVLALEEEILEKNNAIADMDQGADHSDKKLYVVRKRIETCETLAKVYEEDLGKLDAEEKEACPIVEGISCTHGKEIRERLVQLIESTHERLKVDELMFSELNTEQDRHKKYQAEVDAEKELEANLLSLISQIEAEEGTISSLTVKLAALRKEEEDSVAVHGNIVDVDTLLAQKTGIEQGMMSVLGEKELAEKEKTIMTEFQAAQTGALEAEESMLSLRDLQKKLGPKGTLGEITKESIAPVTEVANQLFTQHEIKDGYIFEIRTHDHKGAEIFSLGWKEQTTGSFVPMETLSDGETVIFVSMLMIAILKLKNPKTKILMIDNLDKISPDSAVVAFLKVLDLFEDFLDNIIVTCNREIDESALPEGWKLERVG